MIRGAFRDETGRRRPFVTALLSIPALQSSGDVAFLVDTGADATLLGPRDTANLRINTTLLPPGPPLTGVGGRTPTVSADATIAFGHLSYTLPLRILAPRGPAQQRALSRIPSLLGRDVLSRFALFLEERTHRVLLLEPHEVDALAFP